MIDEIWYQRFDILDRRMVELIKAVRTEDDFPRKVSLLTFLDRLRIFAEMHFKFFFYGFIRGSLQISERYPPDHVLAVVLEQISFDLEAITWAIDQRIEKFKVDRRDANEVEAAQERMSEVLEIADKLCLAALQPAINRFDLKDLNVITYFQKFPEIRMIPYVNMALIGIPFTCVSLPFSDAQPIFQDYLAIPHEVAHYVFWHGTISGKPMRQHLLNKLAGLVDWGEEWLEEVFADVYGCLIAGPVIANMFQDLQLRNSQKQFVRDDGEHPVPILRPDIYTKVLHKCFPESFARIVNERWITKRSTLTESVKFMHRESGQEKLLSDAISMLDSRDHPLIHPDLDKPLDVMINLILQEFGEVDSIAWWREYYSVRSRNFFKGFGEHFKKQRAENFKNLASPTDYITYKEPDHLQNVWLDEGWAKLKEDLVEQSQSSEKAAEQVNEYLEKEYIPTQVWLKVFQAGGWATKGPDCDGSGGVNC